MSHQDVSNAAGHGEVAGLQARVQRLEDLEALRQLKGRYAYRVDRCHVTPSQENAEAAAALFSDDAVLDLPVGRYEGKAAILNAFAKDFPAATAWSVHYVTGPDQLEVHGDKADGRWYVLFYLQGRTPAGSPPAAANAYWGIYEEKYVRTATGWKFQSVHGVLTLPRSA